MIRHGQVKAIGAVPPRITPANRVPSPNPPAGGGGVTRLPPVPRCSLPTDPFEVEIRRYGAIGWSVRVTHGFMSQSAYCFTRAGADWWIKRTIELWRREERQEASTERFTL